MSVDRMYFNKSVLYNKMSYLEWISLLGIKNPFPFIYVYKEFSLIILYVYVVLAYFFSSLFFSIIHRSV